MVRSAAFVLLVVASLLQTVSADWCASSFGTYYCSPGQTCGSYYGDCRGLPTYAIVAIVSTGIVLLSVCVRCCIHLNSPNNRPVAQRVPVSIHNPRQGVAGGRPITVVPIHSVREDAPPPYASVVTETTPGRKY